VSSIVKQRIREVVKYLVVGAICVVGYKWAFFASVEGFSDGRFMTNLALGIATFSAAMALSYVLLRFVVFRDSLKQDGNLARYFALSIVLAAGFLALSWIMQDMLNVPVVVARTVAGLLMIALAWPIERFWVFQAQPRKQRNWLHVLGSVALMLVVSACVTGVTWLTTSILSVYLAPLSEQSSEEQLRRDGDSSATEQTGEFTVHAKVSAIGAASDDSAAGVDFTWNDEWFFQDNSAYNQQLALASSVLAAFANSESNSYNGGSGEMTMNDLLDELGFDRVQTTSYEHRSTIQDNLATLASGATDTVAYTLAAKQIESADGQVKTLVAVAVRGSYGSEWLSDFNIAGQEVDGYGNDHVGFAAATAVVMSDLRAFLADYEGQDVCLLVCGHSRGSAVSNLLAAKADDGVLEGDFGIGAEDVYCYTLACPTVTTCSDAHEAVYDNIFNLLVPSDIVPKLPLEQWGYGRYGRDAYFPREGSEAFDEVNAQMQAYYKTAFGLDSPSDPDDTAIVEDAIDELGQTLPECAGLGSLDSLCAVAHLFVYDVNTARVLASHYLPTYLSWVAVAGDATTLGLE
jgi:putative flippase GtrA/pimeloyl-ACP methyl ester carboxylesterase